MSNMFVPTSNIIAIIVTLIIAIGLPIFLFIIIRKKTKADISVFFIGCGVFLVFAMILEQIPHYFCLVMDSPVSQFLNSHTIVYALYGGLMAGIFEETGRFLAMKFCMKKKMRPANALMYGAGHGGMEAILIIGLAYCSNLVCAYMINAGVFQTVITDENALQQTLSALEPLVSTPAYMFLLAGVERIMAVLIQLSASVVVFAAVANKKRWYLYHSQNSLCFSFTCKNKRG